jgi:hypothetical protein
VIKHRDRMTRSRELRAVDGSDHARSNNQDIHHASPDRRGAGAATVRGAKTPEYPSAVRRREHVTGSAALRAAPSWQTADGSRIWSRARITIRRSPSPLRAPKRPSKVLPWPLGPATHTERRLSWRSRSARSRRPHSPAAPRLASSAKFGESSPPIEKVTSHVVDRCAAIRPPPRGRTFAGPCPHQCAFP